MKQLAFVFLLTVGFASFTLAQNTAVEPTTSKTSINYQEPEAKTPASNVLTSNEAAPKKKTTSCKKGEASCKKMKGKEAGCCASKKKASCGDKASVSHASMEKSAKKGCCSKSKKSCHGKKTAMASEKAEAKPVEPMKE